MKECVFCEPSGFGTRKLTFEDKNGYWYAVVPKEIGSFGQVLLVVSRMEGEKEHISDISDPKLLLAEERLLSIARANCSACHNMSKKKCRALG
jgi:hypothetical protein